MSDPTPLWSPTPARMGQSQLAAFAQKQGLSPSYPDIWRWSVENPEKFWDAVWEESGIIGDKISPVLVDANKMPGAQFFPQSRLNYAENLLCRRDEAPAILFRDERGHEKTIFFKTLYDDVSRLAKTLKNLGVGEGDRVAGFLPNIPETIVAMLAATSLGAVWSSASPDFGVQGVLDRFGQIEPKVLIAVDGYFYGGKTIDCRGKIREIQPALKGLSQTLIVRFAQLEEDWSLWPSTTTFDAALAQNAPGEIEYTRVPFNAPLFIMFSSGTTGVPKCIVHGVGGTLLQHAKEHRLHCDIRAGDRVFYFTTCGWMMWNWLVSALATGATLMLFDGSPFHPDGLMLWDWADRMGCTFFGTSAKFIDALKAEGLVIKDHYKLESLRTLASTGSPLVHESFDYIYRAIKSDLHVASISGGTDIVSCFVLGNPLSPVWRGEIQGPGLGMAVDAFNDDGKPIPPGAGSGELVCTKPFPCMPIGFWNDPEGKKYKAAYFERFDNIWCHGDWIERTGQGGFIIHGRSDATLNPGGVRIGTAEIYRQVEQIPEVAESLAVGQDWQGDVRVILFVRLKSGAELSEDLVKRIKTQIRTGASPRHVPAKILAVADIPRTRSGKIVELAVREILMGRPVRNIEALANPQALDLFKDRPELKDEA